jgi:hypothetical protein
MRCLFIVAIRKVGFDVLNVDLTSRFKVYHDQFLNAKAGTPDVTRKGHVGCRTVLRLDNVSAKPDSLCN